MARKYLRPPWFVRNVVNRLVTVFGNPVLEVLGRKSGQTRSVPVNVLEHDGGRFLVAPRGETDWVRNLRAAGSGTIKVRRRREPFSAVEVADDQKPALIDAYKEKWGKVTKGQWEELPDPSDHPVFRMEPA